MTVRRRIRPLEQEKRKKHKRKLSSVGKSGAWPLNAPGMPPPGPDFLRVANALAENDSEYVPGTKNKPAVYRPGDRLEELYRRALREPGFTIDVEIKKGSRETVSFVPGHIWGQHGDEWARAQTDAHYEPPPVDGPHPAEVFILGKMPWKEETEEGRNLVGASGEILKETLDKLHIRGTKKWYVSNLVKFMPPETAGTTLKAGWIRDCLPLLHAELRIVRPKYILCLGADASKWLLGDKFNVSYMAGRAVPLTFPINLSSDEEPEMHTAHVMTVLHPAEVARSPEKVRILESNLARFAFLIEGNNPNLEEQGLDHRVCHTLEDAAEWVEEVNADFNGRDMKDKLVAWDLEWQGQHPVNKGTYVRTIQASWGFKKAITFVISHAGGKKAFRDRDGKPAVKRLVKLLNTFMSDKRAVGHFLTSDLEWAHSIGFYPENGSPVPLYDIEVEKTSIVNGVLRKRKVRKLAWERLKDGEGWIDTAYMNHSIEETAPLGLEMGAMRFTTCPRYDIPLEDWKEKYCQERGIKKAALEGYGDCPDHIIIPYGNYDADVTLRICTQLMPLLDADYEGNCCWEPFWESMIILKPILNIHKNGIVVDRKRIDVLTVNFLDARAKKEQEIRDWARWHECKHSTPACETCKKMGKTNTAFNIRSVQHVREFLFGEQLNGKKDDRGQTIRIRPERARSLFLEPLLDTSKPPRLWSMLKQRGLDRDASPGTGKMILGILAQDNLNMADQINMVRDYRFLDQALKSVLRPPKTDEHDNWVENDLGELEYDAGLAGSVDDDGRVRTHIYPTAETGRWKHSRPNLANISKSRDPDYERLLGKENYRYKLRSVLRASPGFALIEFDYKGAELYGMALMAGSTLMQDHCIRSLLPDEGFDEKGNQVPGGKFPHPQYYDIHSNVAVLAFQLKCLPTKGGLKSIGKAHFRTLAKNVIFGIAYGRQAKAIALQAREQGIRVSVEEAQQVIDTIFALYPELVAFFESAKSRALDERWLCNCFGRLRRFPRTSDFKMEGEFERQAMNYPIQSMIASAVDRGLAYLDDIIERQGLGNDLRLLLQIHDAGLVECRYHLIPHAIELIKWAMVDMVEIWPTSLDGAPRGDGPYRLGLEFEVSRHWGEKYSKEKAEQLGIPLELAM